MTATRHIEPWGRIGGGTCPVLRPASAAALPNTLSGIDDTAIARGMGRSYGDTALGNTVIDATALDLFCAFDAASGVLRAGAGVTLDEILKLSVPQGWFLPVLPGTKFVTLGGAVANDVHGKNHHLTGTFGEHVRAIGLVRSDQDETLALSPTIHAELFRATIGGLGLTGLISWVELQLQPLGSAMYDVEHIGFAGLDDYFDLEDEGDGSHYKVAWVDAQGGGPHLGRGIFSRATEGADDDRTLHANGSKLTMPIDAPGFALNTFTVSAFNFVYYKRLDGRRAKRREHYSRFLFPLDAISHWNRMYGRRGFYQYQCVVPRDAAKDTIRDMLTRISKSGEASFLSVLKAFADRPAQGILSFPMEGTTLALDFPNRGERTLSLMAELDDIVSAVKGRLYPAKDGRISATMFRKSYPNWQDMLPHVDPKLQSRFWRRVTAS